MTYTARKHEDNKIIVSGKTVIAMVKRFTPSAQSPFYLFMMGFSALGWGTMQHCF